MQEYYKQIIESEAANYKKLPPHVYGLSAAAYKDLFINDKKQAIVISGESGAGKTENAKYAMKYITKIG